MKKKEEEKKTQQMIDIEISISEIDELIIQIQKIRRFMWISFSLFLIYMSLCILFA